MHPIQAKGRSRPDQSPQVLTRLFPSDAARLNALADDAALSRVVGGIHYRFDGDVGLALGRRVAGWAIQTDVNGGAAFVIE